MQDSVCNQLLKTRPLANLHDGQLRLHARLISRAAHDATTVSQETRLAMSLGHELYLIIPKKRYRLAVDRNRVRRVVKAQIKAVLGDLATQYQWVFRTPANKASGVCTNPHAAAFGLAITDLVKHAQQKLIQNREHYL